MNVLFSYSNYCKCGTYSVIIKPRCVNTCGTTHAKDGYSNGVCGSVRHVIRMSFGRQGKGRPITMHITRRQIRIVLVVVLIFIRHLFPDLLGQMLLYVVDIVGYITLTEYLLKKNVFKDDTNND